ncbi:hypothetical protein DQG13_19725 [Paenibacillus sp. YN15]|nr:hypothetical protein DQG13_19725 [Paenibacillus sp. YN15]
MTNEQRKDWRTLPVSEWNTLTFTVYFTEKNAELYGVEYVPLRNWRFEQAQIKRMLDAYGPEILRQACEECFRDYKPTREYPVLTAGFALSYRVNTIIPRLVAERAREERRAEVVREGPSVTELEAWL